MTTNQMRLQELREEIRHNQVEEAIDKKDANTRRYNFVANTVMRPIEDVLDVVKEFIPTFKFNMNTEKNQQIPINERNLRAALARIKDLPVKEQTTSINNYITKQINYRGGRK